MPEAAPVAMPEAAASAPLATPVQAGMVNVLSPEGEMGSIPHEQLDEAMHHGYTLATPEHVAAYEKEQKYGSAGQQAIAGLEGVAKGVAGPLATAAEKAAGVAPEDIEGRSDVNPGTHLLGEGVGLAAPALVSAGSSLLAKAGVEGAGAIATAAKAAAPFTQAGILDAAGEGALHALGMAEAAAPLAKIGSAAVKAAVENAVFQGGDEMSKMILGDPDQSAQTAMAHVGLAGLIGAPIGGAFGSVSELWKVAQGTKAAGFLKALADKVGGIDGAGVSSEVDKALGNAGVSVAPEMRASLSADPEVRAAASALNQTDTTASGRAYQEAQKKFRKDLGDSAARSMGVENPEMLGGQELSHYEHGKTIGNTLAKEWDTQMGPIAKEYDALHAKFQGADLEPSVAAKVDAGEREASKIQSDMEKLQRKVERAMKSGNPEAAIDHAAKLEELQGRLKGVKMAAEEPGTVDRLSSRISDLAEREGWTASPSSDIMQKVNKVLEELPLQKNLRDLRNFISQVGNNMQGDFTKGPLIRAGRLVKGVLRDAESEIIGQHLGAEGGAEALARYQEVRTAYAKQSELREALDERLRTKGSTSGYGKSVREMAQADGEKLARNLSGKADADLLNLLDTHFPETGKAVKQYHIEQLLKAAASGAKGEENISVASLRKALGNMSPELRNFVVPKEAISKIESIGTVLDRLNDATHNFSNTARTVDKLMAYLPGSATGMVTMLLGHNPATALLMGTLAKALTKDAPDAIRLAMLKFMGSQAPIEAAGMKSMVEFIHETIKGENLVQKATKNIFKAGQEVLPEAKMPSETDRNKLDKALKRYQEQPQELLKVAGQTGHYMPEHAQSLGQTAAGAVTYLNSKRPNTDVRNPLDTKMEASPGQKAAFNRTLDIANQPLLVLHAVKQGRITPSDVVDLKNLYPKLYDKLATKLTTEMMEQVHKGQPISYQTRLGLSLFLGKPLDSTMTPEGIQATQAALQSRQNQMQQSQGGQQQGGGGKHSLNSLSKGPAMYQTANQKAESRNISGK
jgi:hypothetical protein